jgi:hypothetical protein
VVDVGDGLEVGAVVVCYAVLSWGVAWWGVYSQVLDCWVRLGGGGEGVDKGGRSVGLGANLREAAVVWGVGGGLAEELGVLGP